MPPKTAWDDVPVGGNIVGERRHGMGMGMGGMGMHIIREGYNDENDDKNDLFRNKGTTNARGRGRGRESVLFASALEKRDDDPEETERLVSRMLQVRTYVHLKNNFKFKLKLKYFNYND